MSIGKKFAPGLPPGQRAGRPPDGTPMNRFIVPTQPGQPAAGGRRGMRTGTGIFLITAGAALRFALAAGSPHGLNVHIVGVILMLAGVAGLLLPRLAGGWPAAPGPAAPLGPPWPAPRLRRATDRHDRRRLRRSSAAGRRPRRLGESPAARRHSGMPLSCRLSQPQGSRQGGKPQPEPELSASAEAGTWRRLTAPVSGRG
jgi:hypothetical protein